MIPTSPADQKQIFDAIREISGSMTRIEGERDYIKESINTVCKNHNLSKRTFRKMVKVYHNQSFSEEVASHQEFEALYETITNTTTTKDA